MKRKLKRILTALAMMSMSTAAFATNGMNMEGYGPIATGMGGASMAYDNGAAAMMNNPATLGLMPDGSRLDVALGYLGPDVKAKMNGMPDANSSATSFIMPAMGWVHKAGKSTCGIGMFAQGGMGTEYASDSFMAAGSGDKVRSELSMGRVIVPYAYEVDKNLIVAGSLDFVWAEMDLKMAMSGAQFMAMATPGQQTYGTASGSMVNALAGAMQAGQLSDVAWTRFDFSDGSSFSGAAKGTGYAGKIGAIYKVSDALAVGATYHSKTMLGDMEAKGATLSMSVAGPSTGGYQTVPVTGTIKLVDFQWPQMLGMGAAYQATQDLTLVIDYKWINWADVMKSFKMSFTADQTQANPMAQGMGLGGTNVDAELFQKWKDQNVIMIGAGYRVSPEFTVRAGLNIANNPIPDTYLNALFPAIEKNHVMLGCGYVISKASSVDIAVTYAPEVKQTAGSGVQSTHSQTNGQLMYSYRF